MKKEESSVRTAIKEFWTAAFSIVVAFAVTVAGIYITESIAYKKEQERLEILAKQRELEVIAKKESLVKAFTWENLWKMADVKTPDRWQARALVEMKPGVEYQIGQLRRYDMRDNAEIEPEDTPKQFDRVLLDEHDNIYSDDIYFHDPVITVISDKFLRIKSSLDGGDGWMLVGETERGLKTDNLKYIPSNPVATDNREYWGSGAISFQVPINGIRGIGYGKTSREISEEMRLFNYTYEETLGEVYKDEGIPQDFAGRTREVTVSQVVVEVWSRDPRIEDKYKPSKPEATYRFIIRSYGAWDVTAEEYEQLMFKVSLFSQFEFRTFSPLETIELVIE